MPFERMVRAVDEWAGREGRSDVFAQIGPADSSDPDVWEPRHIAWTRFLDPPDFQQRVNEAKVLVAHAGMGSIITALQAGKPILVMPRRGDLQETRNDHQVATAERFYKMGRVRAAFDETQLVQELANLRALRSTEHVSAWASEDLLEAIRHFIDR